MQIKATFLLLTIGIMMVHNVFPHVHHQHGEHDEVLTSAHHHGSNHHHWHSGNEEKDEGHEHIALTPVESHAHTYHSHEFISLATGKTKVKGDSDLSVACFAEKEALASYDLHEELHRYALFKQSSFEPVFLSSVSPRGPPALG